MYKIEIRDEVSAKLTQIAMSLARPRALMASLGGRMVEELQEHFMRRDAKGNKRGWTRTNFWANQANGTELTSIEDREATVTVATPKTPGALALKIYGGTIRPRHRNALAMPLQDPRGVSAGELPRGSGPGETFLLKSKKGNAFIARHNGKDEEPTLLYILLKSVTQAADPKALPDKNRISDALQETAGEFLERIAK